LQNYVGLRIVLSVPVRRESGELRDPFLYDQVGRRIVGDTVQQEGADNKPKPGGAGGEFATHPIHESLGEPDIKPPNTLLVTGYLKVDEGGTTGRVYLDLSLRTYYQVTRKQVLYVGKPDSSDATKATPILLDASQPLTLVQTTDASYLRGHIASNHPLHAMKCDYRGLTDVLTQIKTCLQGVIQGGVIFTRCPGTPP
jgi:hypothetical protein